MLCEECIKEYLPSASAGWNEKFPKERYNVFKYRHIIPFKAKDNRWRKKMLPRIEVYKVSIYTLVSELSNNNNQ